MPAKPDLWRPDKPLLLASTSATRRALLESAGLAVDTEAPGLDERAIEAQGEAPRELALRLAREKALAVSRRRPDRIVLGADQTLDLDGEILHKAGHPAAVRDQIARLAGRTHRLHGAAALARGGAVLRDFVDSASLTMRPLTAGAIALYCQAAGPNVAQSVGGYAIEGVGIHLFERVEGDHATIMGLPLLPLLAALRDLDLLRL